MFDLLDNTTKEPPAGVASVYKTIKNIVPALSEDVVLFNFKINNASTLIGTGHLPDGIPLDFFNNTDIRKAFAYAFNWSKFGAQVYYGESQYRKNMFVLGLYPDYYNDATIPTFDYYYESKANAETALKAVMYNGTSVWDQGFSVDITYNTGNTVRQQAAQQIADFFTALSTYDGRSALLPPFKVTVKVISWTSTIGNMIAGTATVWTVGWLADFADADNWVRTFMHSSGSFTYYQNYNPANGWGNAKDIAIDTAVLTPDGPARTALYNTLQHQYYTDVPSFPLCIPTGRRWCQYWVKGWYYDAVYPGFYYRNYWKADACWFDSSGPTPGHSDGSMNMMDIAYLIAHFNAPAPVPGSPTSPKWVGVYGANGCVDTYGDRTSNMKDIAAAIQHFNHKQNTSETDKGIGNRCGDTRKRESATVC
jgi:peptide/nickel transport system substrate-binding protein